PEFSLCVFHQMVGCKLGHIHKCQTGQAAEDKDIPYLLQTRYVKFLVPDGVQFLTGKEADLNLILLEMQSVERVSLYPFIAYRNSDYFTEILDMLQCGIVLAVFL